MRCIRGPLRCRKPSVVATAGVRSALRAYSGSTTSHRHHDDIPRLARQYLHPLSLADLVKYASRS